MLPSDAPPHPGQPCPTVLISPALIFAKSPIHGTGGFAAALIPTGTKVIEYVGQRITKQESVEQCEHGNDCVFYLDAEHDLDGAVPWNPARFLNHSCEPNCEAELIDGRIWMIATRNIAAGEEITFDYG